MMWRLSPPFYPTKFSNTSNIAQMLKVRCRIWARFTDCSPHLYTNPCGQGLPVFIGKAQYHQPTPTSGWALMGPCSLSVLRRMLLKGRPVCASRGSVGGTGQAQLEQHTPASCGKTYTGRTDFILCTPAFHHPAQAPSTGDIQQLGVLPCQSQVGNSWRIYRRCHMYFSSSV